MRKKLLDSLKRVFRPEFNNRLDGVIVFRALTKEDIRGIVNLELNKVAERLQEHHITLHATDAALDLLAVQGYDPDMGARPLRRVIQQSVEDRLSDSLLAHEFADNDTVMVDVNEAGEIYLRHEQQAPAQVVPAVG
jgi:ATP-dependent Clp protease ATP-binding subunit ClpC